MDSRSSNGRGLAKTHEILLGFRAGPGDGPDVRTAHLAVEPPVPTADPKWNCASLAFGPFHAVEREHFPVLEDAIEAGFAQWREAVTHLEPHPRIRWYHFAFIRDHSFKGKTVLRAYLDGIPAPTAANSYKFEYLPEASEPLDRTGAIRQGGQGAGSFATIDELRISREPRYPRCAVSERAFDPPDALFDSDEKTLLICRFDNDRVETADGSSLVVEYEGFR